MKVGLFCLFYTRSGCDDGALTGNLRNKIGTFSLERPNKRLKQLCVDFIWLIFLKKSFDIHIECLIYRCFYITNWMQARFGRIFGI